MSQPPVAIIDVERASGHSDASYGIVAKGVATYDFVGRGIHNPHHPHLLQVWDNSVRPVEGKPGAMRDPHNVETTERLTFSWSAQSVVISAHPGLRDRTPRAFEALSLGDVVEVRLEGVYLGTFRIEAKALHNPHLVKL